MAVGLVIAEKARSVVRGEPSDSVKSRPSVISVKSHQNCLFRFVSPPRWPTQSMRMSATLSSRTRSSQAVSWSVASTDIRFIGA